MSHAVAVDSGYKTLPLSMLQESSTNPRRTFEPTKLAELAHSLTVHGLIQPITVRPVGDTFEIVAGARRFRAAQITLQKRKRLSLPRRSQPRRNQPERR